MKPIAIFADGMDRQRKTTLLLEREPPDEVVAQLRAYFQPQVQDARRLQPRTPQQTKQGNVWEWVWDWYAPYPSAPQKDPVGPLPDGSLRVVRGGSWGHDAGDVRVAIRFRVAPGIRYLLLGFRLVRSYP